MMAQAQSHFNPQDPPINHHDLPAIAHSGQEHGGERSGCVCEISK